MKATKAHNCERPITAIQSCANASGVSAAAVPALPKTSFDITCDTVTQITSQKYGNLIN